jgi:hypothetical protein
MATVGPFLGVDVALEVGELDRLEVVARRL